jgi:large subunit ribosomal protein L21
MDLPVFSVLDANQRSVVSKCSAKLSSSEQRWRGEDQRVADHAPIPSGTVASIRQDNVVRIKPFCLPSGSIYGILGGFFSPNAMAYAIIKTGGRQFRVAEGDTIDVDVLELEPGKTATFGDVLMFADGDNVTQGDPLISGAKVTGEVLEQRKDKKVIAFKYKRRKGYHRTVGHRRKLTRVKIKSISLGAKKGAAKKTEE